MVPAVISKIISMQSSFTVNDNEIAQYVINNAEDVVTSTITTIAKNTGTSEASINRFCKKIGFKGFNGFKVALAQENFYNTMKNEQRLQSPNTGIISSVSHDYRHMLVNTSAMLDENTLIEAVTSIKQAKQIYIFSFSNTALVAQEFEFRLSMIGLHAKSVTDLNSVRIHAGNIHKNDLVIIIVPTILMRDIYQSVTLCKDREAKILTITSYDSPKLNDLVDYKFVTSDKITIKNSIGLSNNLLYLFVVDIIYSALLESDKSLRQKKLNSDSILNNQQLVSNYILEY